jgi:SulP family sulfate permease
LALVPEAVAFAIIAGIPPLVGLYGAFMVCLITAVAGGRPGHDLGRNGRLGRNHGGSWSSSVRSAVWPMGLGEGMGLQYLFAALLLMGLIQIAFGTLRLGRFVRLIPQPVMFGFVNGLAIVIFQAQFPMFTSGSDHQRCALADVAGR